jgi:FMN phosphatase YigB (HAD superfamily)
VTNIFLDIGFTLIGGPKLSPAKQVAEILQLGSESLFQVSDIVFCQEHYSPDSLICSLEQTLGIRLAEDQLLDIRSLWKRQYLDAYELKDADRLLRFLMSSPAAMHIVSNIWHPFFMAFETLFPTVMPYFSTITVSYKEGVRKPSRSIFERALARSQASPQDSIMVGDSFTKDIVPCCDLGMTCIWVKSRPGHEDEEKNQRSAPLKSRAVFEVENLLQALTLIQRMVNNG